MRHEFEAVDAGGVGGVFVLVLLILFEFLYQLQDPLGLNYLLSIISSLTFNKLFLTLEPHRLEGIPRERSPSPLGQDTHGVPIAFDEFVFVTWGRGLSRLSEY